MRKIWLLLFIIFLVFVSSSKIFAASKDDTVLKDVSKIEKDLFNVTFSNQNLKTRLSKIEKDIYGVDFPKLTVEQRLAKIKRDTGFVEVIVQNPQSKQQIQQPVQVQQYRPQQQLPKVAQNFNKEADEGDYPIVDKMETSIFKTTYKSENIYKRLDRLEQKLFGTTNQTSTLSDRVSALRQVVHIPSEQIAHRPEQLYAPTQVQQQMNYGTQQRQLGKYSSNRNIDFEIGVIEQQLYGQTFPNFPAEQRLSRVEYQLLKRDYPNDDIDARLERLNTVVVAKSTAKNYDSNRTKQYFSTGLQLSTVVLLLLGLIL